MRGFASNASLLDRECLYCRLEWKSKSVDSALTFAVHLVLDCEQLSFVIQLGSIFFWSKVFEISLRSVSTNCMRLGTLLRSGGAGLSYLFSDILTALEIMVSIRQDFWLHNGHQAMLTKEKQGGIWGCGKTTVLVVCPDFGRIPSCCIVLLPLPQIPLRDLPFKIPTVLSQGTVRRGRSTSGEVAGGWIPAGRCWHSVPVCWHSLGWQVEKVLCW